MAPSCSSFKLPLLLLLLPAPPSCSSFLLLLPAPPSCSSFLLLLPAPPSGSPPSAPPSCSSFLLLLRASSPSCSLSLLLQGYGFVDFDSPAAAQQAVAALKSNGVQAQMAKQQEQDPTNLYLSNLPLSVDEQQLEALLKAFGPVVSTRVLRDPSGASRGVGFARMESKEKCEAVIAHFNGKFMKTPPGAPAPLQPLLCKFADGGQKKRQSHNKFVSSERGWLREGERLAGMTLTYDPTAAMHNGLYASPYGLASRMMGLALSPYVSTVSPYQVQSPWAQHQPYIMQHPGAVLSPSMEPAPMLPLSQGMGHLSLSSTAPFLAAGGGLQGAYLSQYAHMQSTALPVEDNGAQSQMDTSGNRSPYFYQQNK
ncbi:unnamed protein product [Boreogadus saida]